MKVKQINIAGQEWCYIDKLNTSWDYCARGDFKINSSILIKNIKLNKNNRIENCLFSFLSRLYSANCDILLEIKKQKIDNIIDISQFEFFWINGSQIKTKNENCLQPVVTPIIENNIISYSGFIEVKKCKINDDLTINVKLY